jgi:hypothetical protein
MKSARFIPILTWNSAVVVALLAFPNARRLGEELGVGGIDTDVISICTLHREHTPATHLHSLA